MYGRSFLKHLKQVSLPLNFDGLYTITHCNEISQGCFIAGVLLAYLVLLLVFQDGL